MAGRFANQEALAEPQGWWKYAKHFVVPGFVNLFDGHCRLHLSVKLGGHVLRIASNHCWYMCVLL
jgi:hypothetical protein